MSKYLFSLLVFFTLGLAHEVKSLLSSGHMVFLVLESPAVKLVENGHKANPAYRKKLPEVVELGGEVYACPYWGRKLCSWADPLVW